MDKKNFDASVITGEQLLVLSSQILVVLNSELLSRGLKPTPSNLRVVMEIIDKSLPNSLSEFFVE